MNGNTPAKVNAPIATVGDNLSLQGYALGIADDTATWLSAEVAAGTFKVPEGYDVKSECTSAAVKLQGMTAKNAEGKEVPILSLATRESVLLFFKDMVTQGLSFINNQCYAILYGNELQLRRSYFGTIKTLEGFFPGYEVGADVIFDGDKFDYKTDTVRCFNYIENMVSSFFNRDNPIIGVYGTIHDKATGRIIYGEVMTRKEIEKSWAKAKSSKTQGEFPTEMAKRTLINRMCKVFLNSRAGDVNPLAMAAYQRTLDNEYEREAQETPQNAQAKPAHSFADLMEKAKANAQEVPF